jgi:hypothetical protein
MKLTQTKTLIHRTRIDGNEGAWNETSLYRIEETGGLLLVQRKQHSNNDEEEPVNEVWLSREHGRQFGLAMAE